MLFLDLFAQNGLGAPDGRPLHAYRVSDEEHARLTGILKDRFRRRHLGGDIPGAFVLWASERFRKEFKGGAPTWEFIFEGLSLPPDRQTAVPLVEQGLRAWRRSVRRGEGGQDLFLFTLLSEGGFPDALLSQATHYRRALVDLVAEVEAAGSALDDDLLRAATGRHLYALPQAFRNNDGVALLSELARSIIELRRLIPGTVPMSAADAWLDRHQPGWIENLPLRLSESTADNLVRGVLRTERTKHQQASGPLGERELRRRVRRGLVVMASLGGTRIFGMRTPSCGC